MKRIRFKSDVKASMGDFVQWNSPAAREKKNIAVNELETNKMSK